MGYNADKYRNRLTRNGNNIGDLYENNTKAFINSTFASSPTFRVLDVVSTEFPDITQIDARVVNVERLGSLREIIFRPNQGLNVGTYVKFDGETWLIFDKWGSIQTKLSVLVQRCNRVLKWRDKDGNLQTIDCIASASLLGSKGNQAKMDIEYNQYDVRLPTGQLFVFVEANDLTRTIKMNQRFIFGNNAYEVFGIDDVTNVNKNGYGIIQFTVKATTKRDGDDFINYIADNSSIYTYNSAQQNTSTMSTNTTTTDNGNKGGRIW